MARPRNTVRTVDVHIMMPEALMSRIYALLMSDLEGRVPHGAQQTFFIRAAEELLDTLAKEQQCENTLSG